jgi:release factor glutamine methyltransferase
MTFPDGSIAALVHAATGRLAAAGIPALEAQLDAELLARVALGGWDRATFIVRSPEPAPPRFAEAFEPLVARRLGREPMAYITGRCEFWGFDVEVTPDVLIPRPESELIVEFATRLFAGGPPPGLIVDVGTGSGCLAIALAREFPGARVLATDVSPAAIEVGRRNARRQGVDGRIDFSVSSLTGGAAGAALVVSNPPYVAEADRASLQPEVRDHEPPGALFAGPDGLDVIRELAGAAWTALAPGGWLVFEFGFGQDAAVRDLLAAGPRSASWAEWRIHRDLQGIPRTAAAHKAP